MRDIFFNGESLLEQGFALKSFPVYKTAEPELEFVGLPGCDGDDVISNFRYKNVEESIEINSIPHSVFLAENTFQLVMALKNWLVYSDGQYKEYRDSIFPGYFTKAICTSIGEIQTCGFAKLIETTLLFNRVPWWYSDLGNQPYIINELNKQISINNPEKYSSLPLIIFQGAGNVNLVINNISFSIKDISKVGNYLKIDGETGNCTDIEGNSLDTKVNFDYPPIFKSGSNTIKAVYGGGTPESALKQITIIPRWRRL